MPLALELQRPPPPRRDPMLPRPYRVAATNRETADICTLELEALDPPGQPPNAPGQFSMLYVPGVGEMPISMSGDSERLDRLVFTVRGVGAATRKLVSLRPGGWLGVRGPFGVPWPLEQARGHDLLLVAGGIGLAPLRSVIDHALGHSEAFQRVTLLYGARGPGDLVFRRQFAAWSRRAGFEVLATVDHGSPRWRGRVGAVTALFRHLRLDSARTFALICGPEVMMRHAAQELEFVHRIPAARIYLDLERNMKCAVGFCGHCLWGSHFICKDGPVFAYDRIRGLLEQREV